MEGGASEIARSGCEARLLRVHDHVHRNPAGNLSLDAPADVAVMSRFPWHRVQRAMTGETCAEVVRRIRMHRAAVWLVETDLPVEKIAARAGMLNVRSFARTFREKYGITPVAFRRRGEIRPLHLHLRPGETGMLDSEMPGRRIAALCHRGAYQQFSHTFERVSMIIAARDLWPRIGAVIGVYHDDPGSVAPEDLRSAAGFEVEGPVPEDLEEIRIPAGRFVVLRHRGPYTGLPAAYDHLSGQWLLPPLDEEPRAALAMEIYVNTPADTVPPDLLTDTAFRSGRGCRSTEKPRCSMQLCFLITASPCVRPADVH